GLEEGGGLLPLAAEPDGRGTAGRPLCPSRAHCPVPALGHSGTAVDAALRARRLISCTVRMTGVSGAASLNWWAGASAFSSSGRIFTRVLICSWRTPRTVTSGLGSSGNWRQLNTRAHQ